MEYNSSQWYLTHPPPSSPCCSVAAPLPSARLDFISCVRYFSTRIKVQSKVDNCYEPSAVRQAVAKAFVELCFSAGMEHELDWLSVNLLYIGPEVWLENLSAGNGRP